MKAFTVILNFIFNLTGTCSLTIFHTKTDDP